MASDILLDSDKEDWVTVDAAVVNVKGSDLILEQKAYRTNGGGPYRRALVHTSDDGLAVNFNNDYPGGAKIMGARLRLWHQDDSVGLPKNGALGDLILGSHKDIASVTGLRTTLWLCVGNRNEIVGGSVAVWAAISVGEFVNGSV